MTNITAQYLRSLELQLGGMDKGVKRRTVSPHDPRSPSELRRGGMQGGDRMNYHGYADTYARFFDVLARRDRLVVVELGILRGAGIRMLSRLFPQARIFGLDVDLSHFIEAQQKRKARPVGPNGVELMQFDELNPRDWMRFEDALDGEKIDIFIDDALHTREASLFALHKTRPLMSGSSAHFVEDTRDIADEVDALYGDYYSVESYERLTVVHSIDDLTL